MDRINMREYYYIEFTYDELAKLLTTNMFKHIELDYLYEKIKHLIHLESMFDRCYGHLTNKEKYDLEIEGLINFEGFGHPWRPRIIFDKEHHRKIMSHCFLAEIGVNLTNEETGFTSHGRIGILDVDFRTTRKTIKEIEDLIKKLKGDNNE